MYLFENSKILVNHDSLLFSTSHGHLFKRRFWYNILIQYCCYAGAFHHTTLIIGENKHYTLMNYDVIESLGLS